MAQASDAAWADLFFGDLLKVSERRGDRRRPRLLAATAERAHHGQQTTLGIASSHGRAKWAQSVLTGVACFMCGLIDRAEQLTDDG